MIPIRRRALDRRTFLRGGMACMALPWLDAMQPALMRPLRPPPRALFVFSPNGMNMDEWRPRGDGPSAEFAATLAPLAPLRERITAFSGLAIDGGRAHGDGPGDHARSASSFLTCGHPKKTGGADLHVGVSVDQAIAAQVGGASAFASLELGMERGRAAGICDSGYSCAYSNNVSWRAPDTPVPAETDVRAVFARLFGDPEVLLDREARQRERQLERSVLDLVAADAASLKSRLGASDRQKLEQYLQSVRELEQRLVQLDEAQDAAPVPPGLLDARQGFPERLALMYELAVLAFASGRTRVVSLMLGNGGSNRAYRFLDVPDGHHDLSHHGQNPDKLLAIAKINRFHVEQFAACLARMAAQPDGDGDLLGSSLVVFGSGLGDGNRHNHDDLPVLLAGEGSGAAVGRGHVRFASETPMANLYLAVMRAMGCTDERFADSTGPLALR